MDKSLTQLQISDANPWCDIEPSGYDLDALQHLGYLYYSRSAPSLAPLLRRTFSFDVLYQYCEEYSDIINETRVLGSPADFKNLYIDIRGKTSSIDKGMIDIFSPELSGSNALPLNLEVLNQIITSLRSYFDVFFDRLNASYHHSNIYLYRDVRHPRALHVDSFRRIHYKVFVACDTIQSIDQGPYCFIPKTHHQRLRKVASIFLNKVLCLVSSSSYHDINDMLFYRYPDSLKFLPITGEIVVTTHTGVHGDFPCGAMTTATRSWILLNYYCRSSSNK